MNGLKWLVPAILLLAPASSFAVGVSLSAGGGYVTKANEPKAALELAPFHEIGIVRLEVPVEMQVKPDQLWAVRPGVKVFIPITGLYARLGYGLGNIRGEGDLTHSAILGVGWQLALLDTLGIFVEGTGEPQLSPKTGAFTAMLRLGAMLNL
jgi:hypothetical protein